MNLSHEIRSLGFSKQSRSAISDDDGRVFMKLASLVLLVAESSRDKNFQKALNEKIVTLVLNTPKNPYIIQATKKKLLAKILRYPKKSRNKIFKPKKILRSSLSLAIRSTPPSLPPGPKLPLSTSGIFKLNNLISVFKLFISSYSVTGRHV